ncbi:flagellar hook-length control protein FliK [bacterium]|nr:flagellar hook-length control protein FliK [bacterium]
MINRISTDVVRNLLTLVSQANKSLPIKSGTIIKALVSAINSDGEAVLRILSGGDKQNIQGTLLRALTQAPLTKGQTVFLEVMGGKSGLQMKLIGDGKGPAGDVQTKGNVRNLLTFISQANKTLSIKPGTIIRATVAAINNDGDAVLRILSSGGSLKNIQGTLINARIQTALSKGQTVLLEVMSGNSGIKGNPGVLMKLISDGSGLPDAVQQKIPIKILNMLARLPQTTLASQEFKSILTLVKSLPDQIKTLIPEFKSIEKLFVNSKELDGKTLNTFIESSAQLKNPVKILNLLARLSDARLSGSDLKPLINLLESMPENIKAAIPEFNKLEALITGTKQINGTVLKSIVQSTGQINIPVKLLNMLAGLTESRLASSEFQSLLTMLRSIPENIKIAIPEFSKLEALLLNSNQIDGKTLKAFIESSGVALETKMKIAVLSDPGSVLQNLVALQAGGDFKSLLLKIRKMLSEQNIISRLKQAGLNPDEISRMTDKFIRNIEFFQFSSRINDMFYTFLPVLWDGFNDGELLFKKGRHNKKPSYTCDLNLDLKTLGRLSISITTLNKDYYITFHVDNQETRKLINSEKTRLKERFASLGMPLKALSINHRKDISFGTMQQKEISMKA